MIAILSLRKSVGCIFIIKCYFIVGCDKWTLLSANRSSSNACSQRIIVYLVSYCRTFSLIMLCHRYLSLLPKPGRLYGFLFLGRQNALNLLWRLLGISPNTHLLWSEGGLCSPLSCMTRLKKKREQYRICAFS